MKILMVVGNDKIGRKLISRLRRNENIMIALDNSSNPKRIFKLLRLGVINLSLLIKMVYAEFLREDTPIDGVRKINSNSELLELINDFKIDRLYLFRAGLIIDNKVLRSRAEILNVHCASIPKYGGLGSIMRALKDGAFEQEATLHEVTGKIDEGKVFATLRFKMDKNNSYFKNEEIAYEAGINLILNELNNIVHY